MCHFWSLPLTHSHNVTDAPCHQFAPGTVRHLLLMRLWSSLPLQNQRCAGQSPWHSNMFSMAPLSPLANATSRHFPLSSLRSTSPCQVHFCPGEPVQSRIITP